MAHYGVLGELELPLALGLLRLGTEGRPSEAEAIAVIHGALDLGIRVLDTADSYGLDARDMHYGEALVRSSLASWNGPRESVRVVTKIGMARPNGRWMPSARPEQLRRAVDGSLAALGLEQLPLLLLHGNDPGCPFEDQLAALAELQRTGKVRDLGLCNVDVPEIRQAQRHFAVAAIQNELSVINRKAAAEGTLQLARELGIPFLAHRPLGGHAKVDTLEKNRAMKPIADRYQVSKTHAAIASVLDCGAPVIALFGARRVESVRSTVAAASLRLDARDRAALAEKISFSTSPDYQHELADVPVVPANRPMADQDPPVAQGSGEVVMVSGIQGAGKSTVVERYVAAGYLRLNRDLAGGSLEDLIAPLSAHLAGPDPRVVLDNTYGTRVSRRAVLRAAHRAGVPVRCVHLDTPSHEALINISLRILGRYGRLLGPEELKELSKTDPNLPPPGALARYNASVEPPELDEGFAHIERVAFVRRATEATATSAGQGRKALLLDVDGTLRQTKSGEIYPRDPDDVEILPGRRERLLQWLEAGWLLFFVSNQSGVASGKVSEAAVQAGFARTQELLDLPIVDVAYCPHPAFPAGCFCRKPMPGMAVALAQKHGLDLSASVMVGDRDTDADFARGIGARYFDAEVFFASDAGLPPS